jgi:hypothetical protein
MKVSQLPLRDLFWLVALVAMDCGWWVDRSTGKAPLVPPPSIGRYHLLLELDKEGRQVMFDTATGET